MPTDEIGKLIVDGDIFIQDKDGQINKIAEIQNFESVQENNQDDAADAVRYAIEKEKSKSVSITITRESSIHLQKMLGIERISRKRFKKLLMGCGFQRNDAQNLAKMVHYEYKRYSPILVQMVIEWIIKSVEKENAQNEMSRDV